MQIPFIVLHILYYGIVEGNLMFEIQSSFTLVNKMLFMHDVYIWTKADITFRRIDTWSLLIKERLTKA